MSEGTEGVMFVRGEPWSRERTQSAVRNLKFDKFCSSAPVEGPIERRKRRGLGSDLELRCGVYLLVISFDALVHALTHGRLSLLESQPFLPRSAVRSAAPAVRLAVPADHREH